MPIKVSIVGCQDFEVLTKATVVGALRAASQSRPARRAWEDAAELVTPSCLTILARLIGALNKNAASTCASLTLRLARGAKKLRLFSKYVTSTRSS